MDPAGGQAAPDFRPEQRAEFVTDETIEHPPCLLRVHQVHIHRTWMLEGFQHCFLGDFMENHPFERHAFLLDLSRQVPRNRFPFAVRICCQVNGADFLAGVFQFFDGFRFGARHDIFRLEIMFDVHAQAALGQIPDVPHRGFKIIFTA